MSLTVLLGPVGDGAPVASELASLNVDGPVALVTAGWEEAERNDAELDRAIGGGTRNLGLFGRRLDIMESDPAYAASERALRVLVADMREVYLVQLRYALRAVEGVRQHAAKARRLAGGELEEAIETVRNLDERYAARLAEAHGAFYTAMPPHDRPVIAQHRAEVAAIIAGCDAVAVAGGHVGVLTDALHLCNLGAALRGRPMVAWSSGAMAVAERVMVVDDHDLAGRPDEVLTRGIGVVHGVVPLPAARDRLDIDARNRRAVLARRVAPRVCVLLDQGDRLPCDAAGVPDFRLARVVSQDGAVAATSEAA
ncbi:MAG: hypothetical protein JF887_09455 [Candidatus Dormibacteraeota bacterium]|uniref:Uncharacterized protein n=1 Tax=Candidatus Amunia macphersoniae TaxID=3127014 RepID=A0A934KNG7_9BACT|nr:hypothetical protein [Candidatus Dormibacteraeota bacterium]